MPRIDLITAEVIGSFFMAVADEMGATLVKTAYSPNMKERGDCSTAVFDGAGQTVAQAPRVPIHLGSMLGLVEQVRKRYPPEEVRPGDMFLANDPYTGGGTHLPDITMVTPVFWDGTIRAFVASIGHHSDVGGMVPGSESGVCRNIFQEGIRLPPVKIYDQGRLQQEILDIVLLNTRTPRDRLGDLRAQFAANQVGIRGVEDLLSRYGAATVAAAMNELMAYSERRIRAAIAALPDGTYECTDYLDNDGFEDRRIKVHVAVTVRGDHLHLDFAGTDPQIQSSKNVPFGALLATAYTVIKTMLDPGLPTNAGYYRAITVTAPGGCLVNPMPPAACSTRSIIAGVVGDVMAGALSQAMPARALAGSGPHHLMTVEGMDPRTGQYFVNYETFAGATGARPYLDGIDAVRTHASGAANLPVECLEHSFPFLVERYELLADSAGAGQYRGGLSLRRDYRCLGESVRLALSGERQHVGAPSMEGGMDGATGAFILNPGRPDERKLPSVMWDLPLNRGDVLSIRTPGAGGWGDPRRRPAETVLRDVREGRISAGAARELYRVAVVRGVVDEAETARLRGAGAVGGSE